MSVVHGIVALEGQEACRTAHSADRSNKGIPLAALVKVAGSLSVYSENNPLHHDGCARIQRIGHRFELFRSDHEVRLPV